MKLKLIYSYSCLGAEWTVSMDLMEAWNCVLVILIAPVHQERVKAVEIRVGLVV